MNMHIVIVDRDKESLDPLIEKLHLHDFQVTVVENSAGLLTLLTKNSVQFLLADSSLLVGHTLVAALKSHSPLARLIVLAPHPSLLGMMEALSHGITDYFPRKAEFFEQIVSTIMEERNRLVRWQHTLLGKYSLN